MRLGMKILYTFFLTACSLVALAEGVSDKVQRKYERLYLEAVCQREAGNMAAQYRLLERAIKINPQGAEAYFDLAMMATENDVPVPAMEYMERAHELQPDNKEYTYRMAIFCFAEDDERGEQLMRSLLSDEDRRNDAYGQLCGYYEHKDDYEALCNMLEQWRPIRSDDEFISSCKLQGAMTLGKLEDAVLIADTLIRQVPSNATRYKVVKGEVLLGLNRSDEALALYRSLSDDERLTPGAQILLYKYAMTTKDKAMETDILKDIVVNPDMAMQTRAAAMRQYMEDGPAESRSARRDTLIQLLLPLPETDPTLLAIMLQQMQSEGVDSLCSPIFGKLLEINPADEYSRISLMQYALRRDDYDEVQRLCVDGLKENATQPLFYYFGGAGLMTAKKYDEALALLEKGRQYITPQTNTELVSSYYGSYGDALHKMGRKQEAYAMYDSALVYNNGNEMCLNNYAYFLSLDNEQLDKAEKMSAYTLKVHPNEPTYLDTYAWILFLQGDYEGAREYIDRALENLEDKEDPENVSLYEHAGDIYYHLDLHNEAIGYWRHALNLDSTSEILKKKVTTRKYIKNL